MIAFTLIGSGVAVGGVAVVNIVVDQPDDTFLHMIPAGCTVGGDFTETYIIGCSDSGGGAWTGYFGKGNLGSISTGVGVGAGNCDSLEMGNSLLGTGPVEAGDTVTVTWTTSFPGLFSGVVLIYAVEAGSPNSAFSGVEQTLGGGSPAVEYTFGDDYPQVSVSNTTLLWGVDYGDEPIPEEDAILIAAHASLSGSGPSFLPGTLTLLDEISSGDLTLAFMVGDATAFSTIEPGGSWTSAGTLLVGNYQFVGNSNAPPPVATSFSVWQRF